MSTLRVLSASLDLHAGPGADHAVVARLACGTDVMQLSAADALGWAKLKRVEDGLVGWAYVCPLGPAPLPAGARRHDEVAAATLELRAGPGMGYRVLSTMPKGTRVTEQIAPAAGWAEVRRDDTGEIGWAFVEYLVPAPGQSAGGTGTAAAQSASPLPCAGAQPHSATPQATAAPAQTQTSQPQPAPTAAPKPAQTGLCYRPSQQVLDSGGSPIIFDVSHFQGEVDATSAYAAGLRGMLHKATEGTGFVDPMYARNRANARQAGMLWGAYHFGVGGDATAQADYFLAHAQPDGETLLVLDFERNPQGASMSLDEARAFVTRLQQHTGKWPGLYGGSYARELLGRTKDEVLGKCWFWLADYTSQVRDVPPTWDYWTIWQYTDGNVGPEPHSVRGVPGGRCDRDRFVGNAEDIVGFWRACGV